jgi:hypothetical protein
MDRSAVQAIVDRAIGPLAGRLGIEHWSIRVSYDPEPTDSDGHLKHGECTRLVDYNSAHISLNPESFDDESAVLATLRHELYHVVLSPFDLYSSSVDRALEGEGAVREILDRVWNHACERAVINLERMFVGLTEPDKD